MNLNFTVKSLGKKRPHLSNLSISLSIENETSVYQFFEALVAQQVGEFNRRKEKNEGDILSYLTVNDIESQLESGAVKFQENYNEKKANKVAAIANAVQVFEDGMIALFVNDKQYEALDETLYLKPNDQITIVRLTFLAGGLF